MILPEIERERKGRGERGRGKGGEISQEKGKEGGGAGVREACWATEMGELDGRKRWMTQKVEEKYHSGWNCWTAYRARG